jgi:hypothetical protein
MLPAWCGLGTLLVTGKFVAAEPADQCFPRFFSERLKHQAADHAESNEIFHADVEDLSCLSQQMIVCRSRQDCFFCVRQFSVGRLQQVIKLTNNSA